jgi:PKD repeat protein
MGTEKRHMDIEELFRNSLGEAGVAPSPAFSSAMMRKVARREFLRFNPARFNIYYAAIITAGIVTALMLVFSGNNNRDEMEVPPVEIQYSNGSAGADAGKTAQGEIIPAVIPARRVEKVNTAQERHTPVEAAPGEKAVTAAVIPDPAYPAITPAGIDGTHSKEGFFTTGTSTSTTLKEMPGSEPLIVPSALTGCQPLTVSFRNNVTASYDKFTWEFGDGGSSVLKDPVWVFENPGEYQVTMSASADGINPVLGTVTVIVHPKPKAVFEITPARVVIPDEEVRFMNYSTGGMEYRWDYGDGNTSGLFEPRHKYSKYGNYTVSLSVKSEDGCRDTFSIRDAFSGSAYFIEMPNAFIPNPHGPSGGYFSSKSDERAEIFHPVWSGVSTYRLQIFSKRGILLFESNDINSGWDGYFNGQLISPGVYLWKISGSFANGQPFTRMGDVTLLKN